MAKVYSKKEDKNRKVVFGFVALFAAVAVIVGVGYAFFSDVITGNGSATAGTLDISGTVSLTQNGTAVTTGTCSDTTSTDAATCATNGGTWTSTIGNLNPGDLIAVNASAINNNGSKSAWIRNVLQFTSISSTPNTASGVAADSMVGQLSGYLWVCTNGETQANLIAASQAGTLGTDATGTGGVDTSSCVQASMTGGSNSNGGMFGAKATYAAPGDVISGSAEADGGAGTTWTPSALPEIYFDAAAPNAAQNGNVAFNVLIQALQYRNNTSSPTETQWSTVVTTPFAL